MASNYPLYFFMLYFSYNQFKEWYFFMTKLKPILWAVVAIWGFGVLLNAIMSSDSSSEQAELEDTIATEETLAAASTQAATQLAPENASNLTCYPYQPIAESPPNTLHLSGSACIGYFYAFAIATNSENAAALRQLNDPSIQLFNENVAKLADIIEESCPREGLSDQLKGYTRGQEMLEINMAFVQGGSMQPSTLAARGRQCQSVYEYYGDILNQRMSN